MESLPNGLWLDVPPGCFPLTTDCMVLAWFARSKGAKSVLDLGSGCGQLGLLAGMAFPRIALRADDLRGDMVAGARA